MTEMTTIPMPRLTEGMEEATIAKWLVEPGARVEVGDELVELETDKATMAYASEVAGHVEFLVGEGDVVVVGVPIARLREGPAPAGAAATAGAAVPPSAVDAAVFATPSSAGDPGEAATPPRPLSPELLATPSRVDDPEVLATPLARRVADDLGLPLGAIAGTGPRGRVLQNDVLRAAGRQPVEPVPARAAPASATSSASSTSETSHTASDPAPPVPRSRLVTPDPGEPSERRPLTTIQRTIARRMSEAKATVPHFQVACDVIVDAVSRARTELQAELGADARGPSLNDFIVRACALALRDHELVNASFGGDHFEVHRQIHVGIAVAGNGGLSVATVTDADRRSILAIAGETRRLAASVRAGSATPAELTGATFTVSNLGMFGMTSIVPVINPPQAAILGVGAAREELKLQDGEVVSRQVVTLTLSGDHRILNGVDAARFLGDVRRLLETPLLLLAW